MTSELLAKIMTNMMALLVSLTFHEAAHALVAYWFGDKTAKNEGRLSLNPAVHADIWGTLVLPLVGTIMGGGFIGWAKPVPVNPNSLRYRKFSMIAVALAG